MNKRSGLSLIEIIISMLIFALIMGGVANLFMATKKHALRGRLRMTKAELVRFFLDPIQTQVRQDQWGSNCISSDGTNTNCDASAQVLDGISYTPEYVKSPVAGTDLRKLKFTLSYPASVYE